MRRFVTVVMAAALCLVAWAQRPQEQYIEKYSEIAVEEMLRSGVPASITLAQGILESGAGLSKLAKEGNNHFGIKCHKGWTGPSMYVDDDQRNECFRVYDSAEDSFRDHSDFLRYRDRYKFLFDLERTDYKGWAYGLKQAGYATDPKYPAKLIQYIEEYKLDRFDQVSEQQAAELPAAPHSLEAPVALTVSASGKEIPVAERMHFPLSRQLYSQNGVPFIYVQEGETWQSIARYYHLFGWEILRYNDADVSTLLAPGDIVYLEPKKKKAPRGLDQYIVAEDGESFHAICQRFAVREKSILKLNGLKEAPELREGDQIKLR